MKKIHAIYPLYIFYILPLFSASQEYTYTNYNSKEGLAGATVYCIQQDKEGFLWFGTETGLSRFDGTQFKNFTKTDGLPDNEILKLFVDSKNRVWIIPFNNSIAYYWKGKIYNRHNDSVLKKIEITSRIMSVVEDRYGSILILEDFAFTIINPDGLVKTVKEIDSRGFQAFDAGLSEKGIFRLVLGAHKTGTIVFDLDNGKIQLLKRNSFFFTRAYWYMVLPGLEVIGRPDSLIFYNTRQNEVFGVPMPENFINASRLNDSLFVINARLRSTIYDLRQRKVVNEFLNGYNITSVFEDTEKNLWFATMGGGVFRMGSTEFRNIRFSDNKSSLSVYSIGKSADLIYAGTNQSSLWAINRNGDIVRKQKIPTGYQNARVLSITADNKEKLVVGSDWGIHKVQDVMMRAPSPHAVKSILFFQDKLLVASAHGVFLLHENSGKSWDTIPLWGSRATCVYPFDNGFYIGTLNGLYELNAKKEAIFWGEHNKLLKNRISAITKSGKDTLWIATYGDGIIGLKAGKTVIHLTRENGLSSNICRNVFVSGNNLWIGTDKGLNKITFCDEQFKIKKFTAADGLGSDMINTVFVDSSMVYVGTPEGITYFDDNKVSQRSDCILHISGITISDKTWNFDTTAFVLPSRKSNIQFEFVALSYQSAGDIVYKYRLTGLDSNWKTTRSTLLNYPALPSGNYELQMVAINKFGIQSNTKYISFTVEKLLQEKTWFRLLMFFLAAGCGWALVSLYIRRIARKEREKVNTLRRLAELEQMALKAQMNPHFIFNSLNSIQHYVMDKDITGANRFITDFSSLMRQTLDFSSKQEISLKEELQYLTTYLELEKVRMENKFTYTITIADTVAENTHCIPPMILQPFVENCIRHGIAYRKDKMGKISIGISLLQKKLVCIIEDNGVGRRLANSFKNNNGIYRQSRGMSLTATRIEMLNKNSADKIEMTIDDLEGEPGNALGTRVTVKFPV